MTRRKAGLLGCKTGPWVPTHDLPNPVIEVSGIGKGVIMLITGHSPDDTNTSKIHRLDGDGQHNVEHAPWMKLWVFEGDHRKVCCTITSHRAA